MTITEMSHDLTGHPFPALHPKQSLEVILVKNVPSLPVQLFEPHSVIRLVTSVACHVAFDDHLATNNDMFLPEGMVEYFTIPHAGGGISFLTTGKPGKAYISLME